MAKLIIKSGNGNQEVFELLDEVMTFGRSSNCHYKIEDGKASRSHFRISKEGDHFKVTDLGSTNGTRMNEQRIQGEALLNNGDVLRVGEVTFTYSGPGAAQAAARPSPPPAPVARAEPARPSKAALPPKRSRDDEEDEDEEYDDEDDTDEERAARRAANYPAWYEASYIGLVACIIGFVLGFWLMVKFAPPLTASPSQPPTAQAPVQATQNGQARQPGP